MRVCTHLAREERDVDAFYIRLRVQKAHNIVIMVCHFVEAHHATPAGSAKDDFSIDLWHILKWSNHGWIKLDSLCMTRVRDNAFTSTHLVCRSAHRDSRAINSASLPDAFLRVISRHR